MKYAKRMVLVPELEYLSKMQKKPKKLTKRQKARNISQTLGKQIRKRQHAIARLRTHSTPVDPGINLSSVYTDKDPELDPMEIVEHIPVTYRNKAKLMLTHLIKSGIGWNDRNEVILASGAPLRNTNIVDLVKEALIKGTKPKPRGWNEFLATMATAGVPVSLFTKTSTIQGLQREQPTWREY